MMTQLFIQPKKIENIATFILIESRVTLNKSAEFNYALCTEDGVSLKTDNLSLTPEQYNDWGNDDGYIINLICAKEGISIA